METGPGTRAAGQAPSLLLAVRTVAAAEATVLARRSGLDLELAQRTIDESVGGSMVFRRFGPRMWAREWQPAPDPIEALHAILGQIAEHGRRMEVRTPTFDAAKVEFDEAFADGWAGSTCPACTTGSVGAVILPNS